MVAETMTKANGDASHASVKTRTQLKTELEATERDIGRYQQDLDKNDSSEVEQAVDAPSPPKNWLPSKRAQKTRLSNSNNSKKVEKRRSCVPTGMLVD